MYNFFALINGVLIGIMILLNGGLTQRYGMYNAITVFNIVAVIVTFVLCKSSKQKVFAREKLPLWFYLGGIFMVLPTLFESFAFGKISMTSIMALSLFGQTISALFFDRFGWLGMKKHDFQKSSLIGIVFSLAGMGIMLTDLKGTDSQAVTSIILIFLSGAAILIYRTLNARMTAHIGGMPTSFISHLVGLPFIFFLALVMPGSNVTDLITKPTTSFWLYLGGIAGALAVFLTNITVSKISAFRLAILSFVGKVFIAILLDLILESSFSPVTFYGGLIISAGIFLNILIEQFQLRRKVIDNS